MMIIEDVTTGLLSDQLTEWVNEKDLVELLFATKNILSDS